MSFLSRRSSTPSKYSRYSNTLASAPRNAGNVNAGLVGLRILQSYSLMSAVPYRGFVVLVVEEPPKILAAHAGVYIWGRDADERAISMGNNKGILCMDFTHRVVKSLKPDPINEEVHGTAYLFTILVKDREAHSGIPIAFMVCNSESISR
ncbi:hypothetical protein BGZ47_001047 [Haplosporangium gracile]|nr:hypothetical protein BGZ47_001047 [Haplosporangium gracile]